MPERSVTPLTERAPTPVFQTVSQKLDVDYGHGIDFGACKEDLKQLQTKLNYVVKGFVTNQVKHFDEWTKELTTQRERMAEKEQRFEELSSAIASFVEEEARQLRFWGVDPALLEGSDAEERRVEAYEREMPGFHDCEPLFKVNRLWRRAVAAFEAAREAKEREAEAKLEEERGRRLAEVHAKGQEIVDLRAKHQEELDAVERRCAALQTRAEKTEAELKAKGEVLTELQGRLEQGASETQETQERLAEQAAEMRRSSYDWEAQKEELVKDKRTLQEDVDRLKAKAKESADREKELKEVITDQREKLEKMRRTMDEQEQELSAKVARVQQYVRERQSGALQAEKKQHDAELLAERWQGEVRRLQAEKDRLAKALMDAEANLGSQGQKLASEMSRRQEETGKLQGLLKDREEEMRTANTELLQKREAEYGAKISMEKQKEKNRSIEALRRKEQELQIKDQQLQAARKKIEELQHGGGAGGPGGHDLLSDGISTNASSERNSRCPSAGSGSGGAGGGGYTSRPVSTGGLPPVPTPRGSPAGR